MMFIHNTTEEERLVTGGLGENHPLLKSTRLKKLRYADEFSICVEAIRNEWANRLAELRTAQAAAK